jgi:hypothetical protein
MWANMQCTRETTADHHIVVITFTHHLFILPGRRETGRCQFPLFYKTHSEVVLTSTRVIDEMKRLVEKYPSGLEEPGALDPGQSNLDA